MLSSTQVNTCFSVRQHLQPMLRRGILTSESAAATVQKLHRAISALLMFKPLNLS